jgi:hypothetical protein
VITTVGGTGVGDAVGVGDGVGVGVGVGEGVGGTGMMTCASAQMTLNARSDAHAETVCGPGSACAGTIAVMSIRQTSGLS